MLVFKCPDCGADKLECVMNGPHTAPITEIDDEGDFEYGEYESSSEPDRFQCLHCGFVLEQEAKNGFKPYTITDHIEVVEWIRKNCN